MRQHFALIAGVLIAYASMFGHHGASAYDQSRIVTFDATVTDYSLVNPHGQIYFDSKQPDGTVVHWACELNSPSWLLREGWTRNTLKPGDHAKVLAHPNKREDARVVFLMKIVLEDGRELSNGPPQ